MYQDGDFFGPRAFVGLLLNNFGDDLQDKASNKYQRPGPFGSTQLFFYFLFFPVWVYLKHVTPEAGET